VAPRRRPAGAKRHAQRADPESLWSLHHRLIGLRRGLRLRGALEVVAAEPDGLLAYRRGDVLVTLNLGDETLPLPDGEPLLRTRHDRVLGPGEGAIVRPPD
jgi:glycosidase